MNGKHANGRNEAIAQKTKTRFNFPRKVEPCFCFFCEPSGTELEPNYHKNDRVATVWKRHFLFDKSKKTA